MKAFEAFTFTFQGDATLRLTALGLALALTVGPAAFAQEQTQTQPLPVSHKDTQTLKQALVGHKVEPIDEGEAQVELAVGAEVPSTVTLYPVPLEVVEAAPVLEAHDFFVLEDGRIVIVDPATLRIVRIIGA